MTQLSKIYDVDINNAPLPQRYEAAKVAISECNNIDECKEWTDKATALASYAKQAGDEELELMSKRIRARAMRRCGELLKMFDGRPKNAVKQSADSDTLLSKIEVGESVGLSKRQQVTANRLANIPEDQFNEKIDSSSPPTITQLSESAIKKREILERPKPEGFKEAIAFHGWLEYLHEFTEKHTPELVLNGISEEYKKQALEMINKIENWLDLFVVKATK